MSDTDIKYAPNEKITRTLEPLPDFRFITAVQAHQQFGPALQRAWRCREDGTIEWRTVPTHIMSVAEYIEAVERK